MNVRILKTDIEHEGRGGGTGGHEVRGRDKGEAKQEVRERGSRCSKLTRGC